MNTLRRQPILRAQTFYTREFPQISSYHHKSAGARMAGDERIIGTDRLPLASQIGAYICGMRGGFRIEGQHFKPRGKMLNLPAVL